MLASHSEPALVLPSPICAELSVLMVWLKTKSRCALLYTVTRAKAIRITAKPRNRKMPPLSALLTAKEDHSVGWCWNLRTTLVTYCLFYPPLHLAPLLQCDDQSLEKLKVDFDISCPITVTPNPYHHLHSHRNRYPICHYCPPRHHHHHHHHPCPPHPRTCP